MNIHTMTHKEKRGLSVIGSIYLLSWLLPILTKSSESYYWGFDGAMIAVMQFGEGWMELINSTRDYATLNAFVRIFRGSCNFLFIACFIFLFINPRKSLYISNWCLLSMVEWWQPEVLIGYYLWCSAGFLLILFSIYQHKRNRPDTNIGITYGIISILFPVIYIIITSLLNIDPQ